METEDKKLTEEEFLGLAESCVMYWELFKEVTGYWMARDTSRLFAVTIDGKPCFYCYENYSVILTGDDFKNPLGIVPALKRLPKDSDIRFNPKSLPSFNLDSAPRFNLEGIPINGTLRSYHPNGQLAYKDSFKKGKRDVASSYSENGNLNREIDYANNILKEYYESGALSHIRQGANEKSYYESGVLKSECSDNTSKEYYESGALSRIKRGGNEKSYYESGVLKWESSYSFDKGVSIEKSYYKNGVLKTEIPHKNGWINGLVKVYDENGALEFEVPFTNGEYDRAKSYYKDATLRVELEREHDICLRYYRDNDILIEILYLNNRFETQEEHKGNELRLEISGTREKRYVFSEIKYETH
ncbi:hypothetical protein RsTz2092_00800 [Deferribacterales bacterium RsTz2092]